MNKNITLFMVLSLFAMAMASETPSVAATKTLMGWIMNSWDYLLAYNTMLYCFMVGQYNIFYLNDGGASLYQCANALVATIVWTP